MSGALHSEAATPLFDVDFEQGMEAQGATPPTPAGAAGGGYEVATEGRDSLDGAAISRAFPAEGGACLQLGHLIRWHINRTDLAEGSLSFWFMPLSLPGEGETVEYVWGGDHAKPYQTFSMKINHEGLWSANYYSWQNNQEWLDGVTATVPVEIRKWNHITFTWGEQGQRLFINGGLAGRNEQSFPISWLLDIRFGGVASYLDGIALTDDEQAQTPTLPRSVWRPENPLQQKLLLVEKKAAVLVADAPPGSDAYCRGLILQYIVGKAWNSTLYDQPSPIALDDIDWMVAAATKTQPQLRPGEIEVPAFDATLPVTVADGHFVQAGRPTYLWGIYSPTPHDSQLGFNLSNAILPGPGYTMPEPGAIGDRGDAAVNSIRRAAADNKVIDLLISLILPGWVDQLDATAREGGAGWFNYNVDSPGVRAMFKSAADVVGPRLAEQSTNLIINLANEPASGGYSPTTTGPAWRAWLMAKHGTISELNAAWGTEYESFLEAGTPESVGPSAVGVSDDAPPHAPEDPAKRPQWYDWCQFNQQRYTAFFTEIRDNFQRHCPDALFTIKWLSAYPNWWKAHEYALNPYGVTKLCDISGCDAWTIYAGLDEKSYWGTWWGDFARMYDLLRSIQPDQPVLNSENHLLRGDDPTSPPGKYGTYRDPVPWQHFYTAMWEQAIHGGGGGEIWTYWESGKGFNINERAQALDATSLAARDLRRYAPIVSSLANEKPAIAILLSSTAQAWDAKGHMRGNVLAYEAANLLGQPVGYMLEEMLPDDALDRYKLLVVPEAGHISHKMNDAIAQFAEHGGKVVVAGVMPTADEYGRPITFTPSAVHWADAIPAEEKHDAKFDALRPGAIPASEQAMRALQLRLRGLLKASGLAPRVETEAGGKLPFGLEWRTTEVDGVLYINVCNFTSQPMTVKLLTAGGAVSGTNLLNGTSVDGTITLQPLEVALIEGSGATDHE